MGWGLTGGASEFNKCVNDFIAGSKWRDENPANGVADYREKTFKFIVTYSDGTKQKVLEIRADLIDGDKSFEIDLD